jgi:hypothetical protein
MVKKVSALVIAAVLGLGIFVVCNSPTSSTPTPEKIVKASDVLLSKNTIQGWDTTYIAHAGTYNDTLSFFNTVNGGAGVYWQTAIFTQASIQGFVNNQDEADCYIFSYANKAAATSTYNYRTFLQVNDSTTLAPFATSVAIGDTVAQQGIQVYAHFANCYFELTFTAQDRAQAKAQAIQFLQAYQAKINAN